MLKHATTLLVAAAFAASSAAADLQQPLMKNGLSSVTADDFRNDIQRIPEDQRAGVTSSPQRVSQLAQQLLIAKSLAALARKEDLDKDPVVRQRLQLQADKALAEQYVVEFEQRKAREFDARRADYEKRARELYLVEKEKYRVPEQLRVDHILVRNERHGEEEARRLIEKAAERVAKGEDFAAVARDISEDQNTARKGGELPLFARGRLDHDFTEAAFALSKPGEVSPIVKTGYGFHLIRLRERIPSRIPSFEELKDALMEEAKARFVNDERERLYESFFVQPGFEMNQEALDALRTRVEMPRAK
jgi:peptidyl-prolyl cis-trans isomerase C